MSPATSTKTTETETSAPKNADHFQFVSDCLVRQTIVEALPESHG
jgi:hypothetical protein